MGKKPNQKINIEKLIHGIQRSKISDKPNYAAPGNAILDNEIKADLLAKWPKLKCKIPPIFLHKPIDFEQHFKKLLNMGIKFYQPHLGNNYTRIICQSLNDHKHMMKYLEKKQLPFHTFGNPSKRKMKVVIRGMPKETKLTKIKEVLQSVSIPVIRVHKMHTKDERKDNTILVLAVVPYDDEGKAILKVTHLLGHKVKLEPPAPKPRQCYRCQKWGHSQRYCHGTLKCVKCAGNHLTKKCDRIPEKEPPKCANCGADHTASYKKCVFYYQDLKPRACCIKPPELVTIENCQTLYRNILYRDYFLKKM